MSGERPVTVGLRRRDRHRHRRGTGIGKIIAGRLGEEGASVALADVRTDALTETAAELEARGIDVEAIECDVSDLVAVGPWSSAPSSASAASACW